MKNSCLHRAYLCHLTLLEGLQISTVVNDGCGVAANSFCMLFPLERRRDFDTRAEILRSAEIGSIMADDTPANLQIQVLPIQRKLTRPNPNPYP